MGDRNVPAGRFGSFSDQRQNNDAQPLVRFQEHHQPSGSQLFRNEQNNHRERSFDRGHNESVRRPDQQGNEGARNLDHRELVRGGVRERYEGARSPNNERYGSEGSEDESVDLANNGPSRWPEDFPEQHPRQPSRESNRHSEDSGSDLEVWGIDDNPEENDRIEGPWQRPNQLPPPTPGMMSGEDRVVLEKYWDIISMCEKMCETIRDHPTETPTGLLIPSDDAKYSKATADKLKMLTPQLTSSSQLDPNKDEVAISVANAIGNWTVLCDALKPLMKQEPELEKLLSNAIQGLNRIVTVEDSLINRPSAKEFVENVPLPVHYTVLDAVKKSTQLKEYERLWTDRIISGVNCMAKEDHEIRKFLENTDFRI